MGTFLAQSDAGAHDDFILVDAAGREIKWLNIEKGSYSGAVFLTNDAVCFMGHSREWYRYSLDTFCAEKWAEEGWKIPDFWDNTGSYAWIADRATDTAALYKMDWTGTESRVLPEFTIKTGYFERPCGSVEEYCTDGTYLYYSAAKEEKYCVMRIRLDGSEAPECIDVYDINWEIVLCEEETSEQNPVPEGEICLTTSFRKLFLKGDTKADKKINEFLTELYQKIDVKIEEQNQNYCAYRKYYAEQWDEPYYFDDQSCYLVTTYLESVLEKWLVFSVEYYDYQYGGAHGGWEKDYYVFDRQSGEWLVITDLVENTEEEICDIVESFALQSYAKMWDETSRNWILDEDRLFVTAEGIGIHYDMYELGSYVDCATDIVIPFEVFKMREQEK